jgi:TRAP-type C4-dicarboxylate transport system permease small subunit
MSAVQLKPRHHVPDHWPAPLKALAWVSRAFAVLEGIGIAVCLAVVVLLLTWQCVERNLVQRHHWFFHVPLWVDGFVRHMVFMLAFIGGAYATYTGRHIRFDAITHVMKGKRKLALRAFTTTAAIAIVVIFTKSAYGFYQVLLEESGEASQVHEIFTPARGAMIMVIGFALLAFHFFVEWLIDIGWLLSKEQAPPEWVADGGHGDMAGLGAVDESANPS